MDEKYINITYPTGKVFLHEGWYYFTELYELLEAMEKINKAARQSMEIISDELLSQFKNLLTKNFINE